MRPGRRAVDSHWLEGALIGHGRTSSAHAAASGMRISARFPVKKGLAHQRNVNAQATDLGIHGWS